MFSRNFPFTLEAANDTSTYCSCMLGLDCSAAACFLVKLLLRLVAIVAVYFPFLSSPDGSYTEDQSQESEMKVPATDFDDEFDDEEPLPTIGTCKALYTFEGIANPPHLCHLVLMCYLF